MVNSLDEFKNGCILMHWQIQQWREDLQSGSDTAVRGW